MGSPSSRRRTKRMRSSITEHSFHGIHTSPLKLQLQGESVTHVSGTMCHLCVGTLTFNLWHPCDTKPLSQSALNCRAWNGLFVFCGLAAAIRYRHSVVSPGPVA